MISEQPQILVIDDNGHCADFLYKKIAGQSAAEQNTFLSESANTRILAEKILECDFANSNCVLFININLIIGRERRQSHKGLELLTWLRVKEVMNHCVLYSFQNAESILRINEKNRLLFSKGTTFIQLPNDFSTIDLKNLIDDTATAENLKINIKPLFNAGKFRHRDANWWGIKQLWDVHRIATAGKFRDDYPQFVKDNLDSLNNAVGVFLNELDVVDLSNFIETNSNEVEKKFNDIEFKIDALEKQKNTKQTDIEECKDILKGIRKQISELTEDFMRKVSGSNKKLEFPPQRDDLISERDAYDSERQNMQQKLMALHDEIRSLKTEKQKFINKYEIIKDRLFNDLKIPVVKNPAKILLIDDNAENGWRDIFSEVLGATTIKPVTPEKTYKDRLEELYVERVKPVIESNNCDWDLILLDLRLFDETSPSVDVEDLSGKFILEKIKEDFRAIPLIITTASNKIWTFEKLINLGADAYWIKEGLDEQRKAKDSAVNYCKLIFLVNKITDERYRLLRQFSDFAEEFDANKPTHWSTSGSWTGGVARKGRVESISKSLNNSVLVLKNYLRNYHLNFDAKGIDGYEFRDELNEAFVLSGLVNKIAGVVEDVHNMKAGDKLGGADIWDRGDDDGYYLYDLRHKQSHAWYNATWETLKTCIEDTVKYLNPPS